jgi:hypothetical protein
MIVAAPIFSLSIIILILVALTILFIFLELKKKHGYRAHRVVAIVIMMISLAGIILRPGYRSTSSSAVLLLTPGYSENQVDSIMKRNPQLSLMHLSNTKPFKSGTILKDHEISNYKIDFIVGEGLPLYQLDRMDIATFEYIPAPEREGLIALSIDENYQPHRKGTIKGTYNNKKGKALISLHGPSETQDSTTIDQKGQNQFSLSFVPQRAGNFTYTLIVRDSSGTTRETIPIHVEDVRRLNILFLQYYPTFETQYLKSYLTKKNHSMILRYQLSKNNFRHEFVNRKDEPVARLSEKLLFNVDLVVADASSLAMLSTQEKANLERSVKLGLGLLTLPPIDGKQSNFFPFETVPIKKDTTSVRLGEKSYMLPASPIRVKRNQTMVPLLSNKSGILNGYAFQLAGKIGFQLLNETYRLSLSGDSLAYAEIWAPLLERVARRKKENSRIKISTPFPWYEDEPLEIEVITSGENIMLTDDSIQVPLREDINVDNVWHTRTWAFNKGWHTLKTNEGTVRPYYIHSRASWNGLSISNQIKMNGLKSSKNANQGTNEISTTKDVPPVIFYLVLIAAAGFIWLSPRL